MNWESASAFFAMGGYGRYVWSAYVVTLLCLVAEPLLVAARHRRALRQARLDIGAAVGIAVASVPSATCP